MGRRNLWAAGIAALVALTVIAATIEIVRLDPNDYKQQIISAVEDATGRTLTLNGRLRVTLSLQPTLEVNDVSLGNLPGGTRADMARAERIEATLSLAALLRHRIEVTRLLLVGPNILFEQVGGKANWVFEPPGRAIGVPAAPPGTPYELRIRNARVQNGMVTWRLPARTKVLGIRALDIRHQTDEGPLDAESVLVYSDNQPFTLKAHATPTAGIAGPWNTSLAFAAYDTSATATGMMDVAGSYELQVEGKFPALAKLNALLPEMRLPAIANMEVETHLTNGKRPGDLPVVGATRLVFTAADLGDRVQGLKLGATQITLAEPGGAATLSTGGHYAGQSFTMAGTVGTPRYPDESVTSALNLKLLVAEHKKGAAGHLSLDGKAMLLVR